MEDQISELIKGKLIVSAEAPLPEFTRRQIELPDIANKAIVAIGMRRAGKTTWLHQCRSDFMAQGIPAENLIFFNFEDERLGDFKALHLHRIIEIQDRLFPHSNPKERVLFFDEIQLVPGWETFIRRLLDEGDTKIFLSGSSAKLLSREIASSMRGRAWEVEIFPFSFAEYLRHHRNWPQKDLSLLNEKSRALLDHHLEEYLIAGGFPESQSLNLPNRIQLLQGYVDTLLMRDVVERYSIANPTALRWLVRRLMASPGGLFSISKLAADLKSQGLSVGKESLYEYLDHLEDAFLLETISVASDSIKRQQVNPRKVYPVDPGFIRVFDRSAKSNLGHALETTIYLELRRQRADISYVRTTTSLEVDFLARYPTGGEALIQASLTLNDPETCSREVRALMDASAEHPLARLFLLTATSTPPMTKIPSNITVLSFWEWMAAPATSSARGPGA